MNSVPSQRWRDAAVAVAALAAWLALVPWLVSLLPLEVGPYEERVAVQVALLGLISLGTTFAVVGVLSLLARSPAAFAGAIAAAVLTLAWAAAGFAGAGRGEIDRAAVFVTLFADASVFVGALGGAWLGRRVARLLLRS